MQKAVLTRLQSDDKQTLGVFTLFDDTDIVFSAKSLELPWLDNQKNISCIPTGRYLCRRRSSQRYGDHFLLSELGAEQVEGRKWILIHAGNYSSQIEGCILLGRDHIDINGDGYRDVTSSRNTLRLLNQSAQGSHFLLEVIDFF